MTDKEIIKQLNRLSAIEPDSQYVRTTRYLILNSEGELDFETPNKNGLFSRSISVLFSTALVAVLLLVLTSMNTTDLSHQSLRGVNKQEIVLEADTIAKDIDIQLQEIGYFATTSNRIAHAETPDYSRSSESRIDELLEEVITN